MVANCIKARNSQRIFPANEQGDDVATETTQRNARQTSVASNAASGDHFESLAHTIDSVWCAGLPQF